MTRLREQGIYFVSELLRQASLAGPECRKRITYSREVLPDERLAYRGVGKLGRQAESPTAPWAVYRAARPYSMFFGPRIEFCSLLRLCGSLATHVRFYEGSIRPSFSTTICRRIHVNHRSQSHIQMFCALSSL